MLVYSTPTGTRTVLDTMNLKQGECEDWSTFNPYDNDFGLGLRGIAKCEAVETRPKQVL